MPGGIGGVRGEEGVVFRRRRRLQVCFLQCVLVGGSVSHEIKLGDLNVGLFCIICLNFSGLRAAMRSVAAFALIA